MLTLAAAVPLVKPADCAYNVEQLVRLARQAADADADITLFP